LKYERYNSKLFLEEVLIHFLAQKICRFRQIFQVKMVIWLEIFVGENKGVL